MAQANNMFIANLDFLLNYENGESIDEIESEIFKVAFQTKETIHYDRAVGAGFPDLEQDPNNITTGLLFAANLIESVYRINEEKNFNPYIILGYSDITIIDETAKQSGEYIITARYKLLRDLSTTGSIQI
jgi:hypothetical protein